MEAEGRHALRDLLGITEAVGIAASIPAVVHRHSDRKEVLVVCFLVGAGDAPDLISVLDDRGDAERREGLESQNETLDALGE